MKIEEQIINIIFDAGRGTSPVRSREAACGKEIGELPIPECAGYSFDGWYMGDELVNANTVLTSEEDVRLVARWSKKRGIKRTSALKKQKTAVVCMAVLIVLLAVALFVVNDLASVTEIKDIYFTQDGTQQTKTYYVKEVKGVWGMYDEDDVRMSVNSDGYHIVESGNQYSIDKETGECKLYALVDSFDASTGELLGFGARVMMYPQINQSDIYSISVKNGDRSFEVLRHSNGVAYLKGTEDRMNVLDDKAFANLATACGYTLTVQKLDFKSENAPKNEDGSIRYEEYGLADTDDFILFTITKRAYDENGKTCAATGDNASYTVRVGDVTKTGAGYYAKLVGRDAVYVLSPTVAPTLVKSVEAMVTPTIIHPMSVNTHVMVRNFLLEKGNISATNAFSLFNGGGFNAANQERIVDFSYSDLLDREYSFTSSRPYHPLTTDAIKDGYYLDDDTIYLALYSLHSMPVSSCVKLGITEDAIKEHLFGGEARGNAHHLTFRYNMLERDVILRRQSYESTESFQKRVLAEAKTILSQYTKTNLDELTYELARTTLEGIGYYLEDGVLYDKATHLREVYTYCASVLADLGYTSEVLPDSAVIDVELLETKVDKIVEELEKKKSGYHYDRETGDVYVINDILISELRDGKYYVAVSLYDMIVEIEEQHFAFLEWNEKNWYSDYYNTLDIAYITNMEIVSGDKNYQFRFDNSASNSNLTDGPASDKLKIYANKGDGEKLLDYVITYATKDKTQTVTALDNFRNFYLNFQYMSLGGVMDEKEIEKLKAGDFNGDGIADGLTPEECVALPDEASDLILYYRAVDLRGNTMAKVCRFYTYSGHAYLTIETVSANDENGQATTDWRSQHDPERVNGLFYVDASNLLKFVENAEKVMSGAGESDLVAAPKQ